MTKLDHLLNAQGEVRHLGITKTVSNLKCDVLNKMFFLHHSERLTAPFAGTTCRWGHRFWTITQEFNKPNHLPPVPDPHWTDGHEPAALTRSPPALPKEAPFKL